MALLKLICITLFTATLTALFTGLVLVTTGGKVVVNLVVYGAAKAFPNMSVILFECMITVYLVPAAKGELGVKDNTLPLIELVNDFAAPVAVL